MARLEEIVRYLDEELRTADVPDYEAALNGLQLANRGTVTRVAAAVDFSARTVADAVRAKADLLVVHHGMFWRGAHAFVGSSYDRLSAAIMNDLAVYSSHIPLDLHPVLGNNVLLARELGLDPDGSFGRWRGGVEIGVMGNADVATASLVQHVRDFSARFNTTAVTTPFEASRRTRRWAIITGAGASSDTLAEARERGVDTFVVGEGAHHTAVDAMESDIVVIYGGHYATETLGVRATADRLAEHFPVETMFVDVPTGL
jgi:dinuclear metal center YbgI/SA1388 family protein